MTNATGDLKLVDAEAIANGRPPPVKSTVGFGYTGQFCLNPSCGHARSHHERENPTAVTGLPFVMGACEDSGCPCPKMQ